MPLVLHRAASRLLRGHGMHPWLHASTWRTGQANEFARTGGRILCRNSRQPRASDVQASQLAVYASIAAEMVGVSSHAMAWAGCGRAAGAHAPPWGARKGQDSAAEDRHAEAQARFLAIGAAADERRGLWTRVRNGGFEGAACYVPAPATHSRHPESQTPCSSPPTLIISPHARPHAHAHAGSRRPEGPQQRVFKMHPPTHR
ncbi:hypothetical protein BS50DRAFT_187535 [Corynespora cassiicola Philippines]|uniref:Uncharacterized protein n=1 Tax=Corynespora cassiicola Philippines TaxID=1448308 RepID=A0A2T2P7E2_CORCC|nr:hypothetical protein BS50DRAFT_187535 [Corynespora cassiicola Philippines]